jgi:hypothetical protein
VSFYSRHAALPAKENRTLAPYCRPP